LLKVLDLLRQVSYTSSTYLVLQPAIEYQFSGTKELAQGIALMSIIEELKQLASVDLFTDIKDLSTFVGRPFYFDYTSLKLLANDAWKQRAEGIPAGALLVAVYDNEENLPEVIRL
jgi:hypothetical protein